MIKLVNLTKAMEKELSQAHEFSMDRLSYLKYTRNYYLLEKDNKQYITNKKVTLIQMQELFDLTSYMAYTLDEKESENALSKQTKPRTKKAATTKTKAKSKAKPKPKAKTKTETKDDKK